MRMSKGSTSGFWNRYNRQQNALVGSCMPSLESTMPKAETYPGKPTNDGLPGQDFVLRSMIANEQNIRRALSF